MSNFIIAIIFLFAVSLFSYYVMSSLLAENFNKNNRLIVNLVSNSLNSVFKEIDDIYKKIEGLYIDENAFNDDIINGNNIAAVINESIIKNDYIEDIIFLRKKNPQILTSQGILNKEEFFNKRYSSEVYGLTFFENIITDYLNIKVLPATSYKNLIKYPTEDPKRLLAFIKTVPDSDLNILIFVSEDKFYKAANLEELGSDIKLKIYDYNDSVIFSNTDSNYLINTQNLSKDFKEDTITRSFKKYYIVKSGYNYFYFVAETDNYIIKSNLYSILILIIGLLFAAQILMKKTNIFTDKIIPIYEKLEIDTNEGYINDLSQKIDEINLDLNESNIKINEISDEIKNSIFIKLTNSSSYYNKNKKTVDLVFKDILGSKKFVVLSVEVLRELSKNSKYEVEAFINYFKENNLDFVYIEERTKKHLFILGISEDQDYLSCLNSILKEIKDNGSEILICYSKEYSDLSNLYDAYQDIKICRDYRGINDKTSILNIKNIEFGNIINLPLNFKDELNGMIFEKNEAKIKEFLKNIFKSNVENNVPVIKFEFMLRVMQNTITEALTVVNKNNSDFFELEQVLIKRIDNLRDDFDIDGILNSIVNLLHLSISMFDTKKSILNKSDVIKYINSHYNEELYLEKIASRFGTTPKYFSNYFKKEFQIGFNEYLTQVRISHAKKLLIETDMSVSDISKKIGYSNQTTFTVAFKKTVAMPPGKYREYNKNK